jgi:hypothetical protein
MPNTAGTLNRFRPDHLFEHPQLTSRTTDGKTGAVVAYGNASGVIASVLKTP